MRSPDMVCLAAALVLLAQAAFAAGAGADALVEAENAGKLKAVALGMTWRFRADPKNEGVAGRWFAPEADTGSWDKVGVDRLGWGMSGFRHYTGWAWCRQDVSVPADLFAHKHCGLFFAAVDEECEVYVNGRKAGEHTSAGTGIAPGWLWNRPFLIDAKPFVSSAGTHTLAVRIHSPASSGGIRKPAFLVAAGIKTDAAALYEFLVLKRKLKPARRDFQRADISPIPASPARGDFGRRIQRTMTRLATSSAACRNRVRMLFYGQSIVQGMHWREIVNALRQRYPYAVIEAEDRAIGGFTAPALIRPAYHDLYPFYADLVVFHVYGGEKTGQMEEIIAGMRKQNTSDIMVFTHQIAWIDNEEGLARRTASDDASSEKMRELAEKYDCELAEVREEWREYLKAHSLGINELMGNKVKSNVHPNVEGHTLLAQLVLRHFQHHPNNPDKYAAAVNTCRPGDSAVQFTGAAWQRAPQGWLGRDAKSALKLTFDGNRVDVLAFAATDLGSAKILVDGKPPSQMPELYRCTRPSAAPYVWWPGVKRVTLAGTAPPVLETWTMTLTDVDKDKGTVGFTLKGSVTGDDGGGSRGRDFVSNSGRIHIAARDFNVLGALRYRKKDCPPNFKITWQVVPLFVEQWRPRAIPGASVEEVVTLVKCLPNGRHTIEIAPNGDGNVPVQALRVHNPPLR